jgi:hypothetical protein
VQSNSITTNEAAIVALFRVVNRYVGNLGPMPGVFPNYNAPAACCRREMGIKPPDSAARMQLPAFGEVPVLTVSIQRLCLYARGGAASRREKLNNYHEMSSC